MKKMSKIPKGVAEQRKKEILEEFRRLGKEAYEAIVAGQFPEITLPSRSVNNLVYDEKLKQYILGSNSVKRSSRNVKHIRPYTQLLWLAFFANQLVSEDRTSTLRDVFYSAQAFNMEFTDQSESDEIITDLETALMKAREDFNVYPDERSAIFGNMTIEYTKPGYEGKRQDLSSHPDGLMIGPALTTAEFVETDAEMVIAIEKGGLFTRFVEEKVHDRFKALLINTAGQPPRSTRYVIRRLNQELGLPVYLLADADPWGAHICMVIKSGSANAAHLRELTTPSAKWLGVYASITGDESVLVEIDGFVRNEPVQELFSRYKKAGTPILKPPVIERVGTFCCDENLRTGVMPVASFSKHRYSGDLFEIVTEYGFRVKATGNHSVQVFNRERNKLESCEVSSLRKGDLLATAAKSPNNQSLHVLNLAELILKECPEDGTQVYWEKAFGLSSKSGKNPDHGVQKTVKPITDCIDSELPSFGYLYYRGSEERLPVLVTVSDKLVRVLGYMTGRADLQYRGASVRLVFQAEDKEKAIDTINCLRDVFNVEATLGTAGRTIVVDFRNRILSLILRKAFRMSDQDMGKRVPFILFNVNDKIKMEYLAACGYRALNDSSVRMVFGAQQTKLASDVVVLFKQLRYVPRVSLIRDRLVIRAKPFGEFLRVVPQGGNASLSNVSVAEYNRSVTIFDRATGFAHPKQSTAPSTVIDDNERFAEDGCLTWSDSAGQKPGITVEGDEFGTNYAQVLLSDVLLVPVTKITNLGKCEDPVYDLEVEDIHTFIGGLGGLVLHNSDIQKYELPHDKLTDLDIKRVHELQKDPRYEEQLWKDELECFLKYKKKAEQEAFSRYGLTYIVDKYLVDKLEQAKSM